jgi:hypothetical protein
MAHGGLLAISGGIIFGLLAAVTGLVDWLGLPSGSQVRRLATTHLLIMVKATGLFVLTWLIQRPGYNHATIKTGAWIVGLAAEIVLLAGGYLGGAIVFVYGERVLKQPTTPIAAALIPGRAGRHAIGPKGADAGPARAQFHAHRSGRVRLGLRDPQS